MMNDSFPSGAVLVVGGSGGIGQAVATEFARSGADVALTYRSRREAAERVAAGIRSLGRRASIHQLTIGDRERCESVVSEAVDSHARLHTIVVGAGTLAQPVRIADMTVEQWRTVIDQDLDGFYNILQATLNRMKGWGGGSYVHLGSVGHLLWPERDVLSVAPKAAIEALITGIAREEGRFNIRANSVLVGVIEAGMFLELSRQGAFDRQWIEDVRKTLALKRWGAPEEVAHACVFLASNRALYVTGQRIAVAGGYGV